MAPKPPKPLKLLKLLKSQKSLMSPKSRRGPAAAAVATLTLLGFAAWAGPGSDSARAGSHIDAPSAMLDPEINAGDLYAFTSPEAPDTVTLITTYQALSLPVNGVLPPTAFATRARYDLNIDSRGTGRPEVTYRWTFRDEGSREFLGVLNGPVESLSSPHLKFKQRYTLEELRPGKPAKVLIRDAVAAPSRAGAAGMPDYGRLRAEATLPLPGGGKVYTGQAADPFFNDAREMEILKSGTELPTPFSPLQGTNVTVMALQVPKKALALNGDPARNPVVGIWATAARETMNVQQGASGGPRYAQVSRVGNVIVNEALAPDNYLTPAAISRGMPLGVLGGVADQFNTWDAADDASNRQLIDMVTKLRGPKAFHATHPGMTAPPANPRKDMFELLMTGLSAKVRCPVGEGSSCPITQDLNSQVMNADADAGAFRPAEQLRLNMSTPVSAAPRKGGFLDGDPQGFPNGRRLTDDPTHVLVRVAMGEPGSKEYAPLFRFTTSGPPTELSRSFPYLAVPHGVF
ncbi:DUF4331 domain-containing protein [Streptomyces indicus]|uniref:DUF4331 domain-containing protein n=1 Tax=Streptomyces indicus TaxID=417292 RepID=A0A1G8UBS9_9ACTN|nr:DUF4331 domain-containing protein [Streptomyces indicus]SDJ51188.1 protein of unknown function [Streptomyces indicus]